MTRSVRIACGNSVCTLLPETGGSIGSWSVGGQKMLRATRDPADPLQCASFPLVPYSNRIADGKFLWRGREIQLPPSPLAAPHAIHGIGWRRPWTVTHTGNDSATMELAHAGDADWPWPFVAVQTFTLGELGLSVELSATNLADEPVPLAFAHHPYFSSAGATLTFEAESFFPGTDDILPLDPVPLDRATDFSGGQRIADCAFDNLFGNWNGHASVRWDAQAYALEIRSPMPHIVLYTAPDRTHFCFEPVPHINNALNRSDGDMPVIAPGEQFQTSVEMHAVADARVQISNAKSW